VPLNIALVGNPNCGKTTLFNALTGDNRYVGNWPGVTVEKKVGEVKSIFYEAKSAYAGEKYCAEKKEKKIFVTDLPGIYSLYAYGAEEGVARDYIFSDDCGLIVNIVDGTNMERNLYLTLQLIETGKPLIIAVNMVDVLNKRGIKINFKLMSERLGAPVLPVSAGKGTGLEALILAAESEIYARVGAPVNFYGKELGDIISSAEKIFFKDKKDYARYRAVKYLDMGETDGKADEFCSHEKKIGELIKLREIDRDALVASEKYDFIVSLLKQARAAKGKRQTLSKKIDAVVTNRYLAVPIFLCVMFLVFSLSFGAPGRAMKSAFEYLYNQTVSDGLARLLIKIEVSQWLYGVLIDGIIRGVGSVLSFLPEVALLFVSLTILEDSGYMARAAFIADRPLKKIGLTGKSFIPMLMGFGCSVPALLATRTLQNERQRRLTMVVIPFMSCGARLPVYSVFTAVFFPKNAPFIIFSLYLLGMITAMLSAYIFKKIVLKDDKTEFIMELPEYRFPTVKNLFRHTFERIEDFALKAGTVIVLSCAAVWFLQNFGMDFRMTDNAGESILAAIGGFIAPIFKPLGFDDWRAVTALLTGITAKESVVSTLEILFGLSKNPASLASSFTVASAYSFLVFTLLYTPCIAALAALKREMQSNKWFALTLCYQLAAAWTAAFLFFKLLRQFG
jgi:ferrous iron transport protein B